MKVKNLVLPVFSLLLTVLLLEGFLRVAIMLDLGGFRTPDLYLSPLSDDDYWKLRLLWSDFAESPKESIDPNLGWHIVPTDDNPLGIVTDRPLPLVDPDQPAILFYGDSYVAALTAADDAIPQQMDNRLDDWDVYNYGVPGYGVGQVYLRLRETHKQFNDPVLLFGILTFDLDRSILTVRAGPKPKLSFDEGGEMSVMNVPITQTAAEWVAEHPPQWRSFLWSFGRRTIHQVQASQQGLAFGAESRVAEKQWLNRQIMAHAADYAAEEERPLVFVIFYSRGEYGHLSWRETFLQQQCEIHVCLDTKPVLEAAASEQGVLVDAFYLADGLHLNEQGNAIVADYLADVIPSIIRNAP